LKRRVQYKFGFEIALDRGSFGKKAAYFMMAVIPVG
jgi:hypothetical protein